MPCPMFGWYEKDKYGTKPELRITSVIEGALTVQNNDRSARIVTRELEKRGEHIECTLASQVREMFHRAGVEQDYGLIIFLPGKSRKLSGSEVVDFISFYRHPSKYTTAPTVTRFGVDDYTREFDALALDQLSDKETRIIEENLPPVATGGR